MSARARLIVNSLLALFALAVMFGQQSAFAQSRPAFSQQQLDQMLAPIALYPDQLLSQILMAATYPDEVGEAARWSRRNPDLNGDRAVRAAERIDWDPSVKSLVAFPQILDMMDAKMYWTEDLGDAFLDQQAQVMDTVQYLRRQAYSAGNLSSSDQVRVDFEDSSFSINYANPEIACVPYYNPLVIYGTWWWPAYQPVYWAPWPGYYVRPGYAKGYAWAPPIAVSRGFFFGAPDWHRHSVNIVNVNNYYYHPAGVNRPVELTRNVAAPAVWQHDDAHRRDVPYREASRQPAVRVDAAPAAPREFRERDALARTVPAQVPAPVAVAQPAVRSAPTPSSANVPAAADNNARGTPAHGPFVRGQDSRGPEARNESAQRSDSRLDAGNRSPNRGSYQQIIGGTGAGPAVERAPAAPVVKQPEARSMPVPTPAPVAVSHPGFEPRANNATNTAQAAGAREHASHAASADNKVAAASSGNARNNSGNSRHP